ncbi:Subtilisin-like serine endopeptidase family protein [Prunus dulcis]|uniref:Subtilisin-like serine endopeptidase family protein n=1 Tax=Prunus dulcis TaxID=3755 RepID=A0A4Y1RK64_PRUDU|nr:Subtilisin-like serine endopeptidase family protein [Prunus dulcis]
MSVYIVYLGHSHNVHDPHLASKHHLQLLSKVFASEEDVRQCMLYSYKHSFSGFSAKLNSSQATTLASKLMINLFFFSAFYAVLLKK